MYDHHMQTNVEFGRPARKLEKLLGRQLGLNSGPLATRVIRGRRFLPKDVRKDLLFVAEAEHLSGNPRIARQIDRSQVRAAYRRSIWHLRGPATREVRKGRMLGALGGLVTNLVLVFVLVLAVLSWRNFF